MFIDDNKALMRRMYGNLVEPSIDLPEMPKTPGKYNRSLLDDNAPKTTYLGALSKIDYYLLFIFSVKSIFFF